MLDSYVRHVHSLLHLNFIGLPLVPKVNAKTKGKVVSVALWPLWSWFQITCFPISIYFCFPFSTGSLTASTLLAVHQAPTAHWRTNAVFPRPERLAVGWLTLEVLRILWSLFELLRSVFAGADLYSASQMG